MYYDVVEVNSVGIQFPLHSTLYHANVSCLSACIPVTPSTLRVAPVCKIVAAVILVSLSLLILLTGIPTTIFFAVECLHATQPDIHNVGAYEGNVMIVTEVYPALTSKFIVEENVLHGDWHHPIHLYLAESSCEQLPTVHREKLYILQHIYTQKYHNRISTSWLFN